jgi:epoxyqueuosine reductase
VLPDFDARNGLQSATLVDLFAWSEDEFNQRLEGSAIRRIGHERWMRNIAVALGNAVRSGGDSETGQARTVAALNARADHPSAMVREHVQWALSQQTLASE